MSRALLLIALLFAAGRVSAQTPEEGPWRPLYEHEGVRFAYLFYAEADARNNGVVVRLHNTNDYPIRYRFKIVFRSKAVEHVEEAAGSLDSNEQKTGDLDGLFWIPFSDGRSIEEIGLRGFRVERSTDLAEKG